MQSAETATYFSEEILSELRKPLDKRLVSERKGGHGKVKYLEGHIAIDQAVQEYITQRKGCKGNG